SIKITNIDKTAPVVSEITADKTSPTNGKVVLSIEAKDSVGLPAKYASWNGGVYGNSNQYEVTANGTYKVTVKDLAGNTVSKSIKITNIDKTAPVVSEITADKTSPTNGKVVLSIEAKDSVGLPAKYASWNGGAYGNSNQYEVTANGTYKVTVKDLAGNKTTKSIKISNIDLEVPVVSEIKADKTVLTNDKVILTVEATDNVGLPEKYASWNSQEYGSSNLYEVSENGIYHVQIRDIAGNTAIKSIEINNIDKENPVAGEIVADKTEATNDKVILSIEVKDNMDLPENHISWNGGEPGNSNRYEVTENGTYQAVIKDAAGNTVTKTIEINNIDKTAPEIVSVITTPVPWYYDNCTITVDATDKGDSGEGSGLAKEAYSWDGGRTWISENTYEVSETGTIVISVRDNAGNIAQAEVNAVKEKVAKKEDESGNSETETEQSHKDSSAVETTPTVSITADVAEQTETTENTSEEKTEEGSKDYILSEIEKEETVFEQESFLEENEMLELDTLENDKNDANGIVILCIWAGLLLGLSILFIAVYVLFGMCRVYEISPAGKEHYLGRVGIGYRKKNFIVKIGMRMIENASERILMIRIPGWFVKINENRPLRIIAGALVITKYVEKEIQFHIQV
ncbi:MAG: hypothetical protein IJ397_05325, partial [Lachnospiraceae bacterium]|nr:hypothetical protein [Lachnospiraceae bacterium]